MGGRQHPAFHRDVSPVGGEVCHARAEPFLGNSPGRGRLPPGEEPRIPIFRSRTYIHRSRHTRLLAILSVSLTHPS